MEQLPENIEKRLREHLSDLELRLNLEKELLEQATPRHPEGHQLTNEEAASYRQIREPIVHTILAYGNAISSLHRYFPELKNKKQ